MKKCRITVLRITRYEDLMAQYENPISHACDMEVGQVFVANGWGKAGGLLRERLGNPVALRIGSEPWWGKLL